MWKMVFLHMQKKIVLAVETLQLLSFRLIFCLIYQVNISYALLFYNDKLLISSEKQLLMRLPLHQAKDAN